MVYDSDDDTKRKTQPIPIKENPLSDAERARDLEESNQLDQERLYDFRLSIVQDEILEVLDNTKPVTETRKASIEGLKKTIKDNHPSDSKKSVITPKEYATPDSEPFFTMDDDFERDTPDPKNSYARQVSIDSDTTSPQQPPKTAIPSKTPLQKIIAAGGSDSLDKLLDKLNPEGPNHKKGSGRY